ncbi:hypothetical protein LEP1GSC161_1500 [Leptospira santarosai str. CBC1416]|uniref:Uncharacterized protein n=4 Tax=Leptospira santarosai TaxID=28183 RepID=M6USN0_9LEPT|nr:hypothetical protein LEP1GSC179_3330 [Leptospira santarosai str. MOR084]EKO78836.1 hypothetical protein LEP1GSC068_2559 [Leptospira sp. Fiocruz LV3954]EKR90866.1 hypothetical protein LEP1GSC163_3921 [Leptospira santarosai str. CBC379]EKS09943.1 hypothetical protein LEP1GSC071_2357 [Leptospira santarosai str. JET]EMI64689.1 hypothetical protein LEP1GSC076_3284 [Leptospira sp. Fiocruz LV4135]EMJ47170.1 hypothetical protein LEP1GSC169_3741 [Leptospira santarosai str. HAI1349]EMM75233.1 hypoth
MKINFLLDSNSYENRIRNEVFFLGEFNHGPKEKGQSSESGS